MLSSPERYRSRRVLMPAHRVRTPKREKLKAKMYKFMELVNDISSSGESSSSSASTEAGPSQKRSRSLERNLRPKRRRILSSSSSSCSEGAERAGIRSPDSGGDLPIVIQNQNFLGDDPSAIVDPGVSLEDAIVSRWSSYLTKGLESKLREKLMEKWTIPANCTGLNPPKLNPDLVGMISASGIKKDNYLGNVQEKMGKGLSALGTILNDLVADKFPADVKEKITPALAEAAQYFCETHFLLSKHRKHEILPNFNPLVRKVAEESTHDSLLFGSGFTEHFKAAQAAEKSSKQMKAPTKNFRKGIFVLKEPLPPSHYPKTKWKDHARGHQATYSRRSQGSRGQQSSRRRY
ncbi:uncharacterized protein LOC115880642 [Sitophilus oryzae]|uniref:Uncharacterized protein LOC115880642 n=1 Tax=Sitophilus oryzae TaxID=7048 RepID=A0A6J2XQW6_SITOR|nr:uncharacterized protein LOC115880642 [Sitophilus oryzae]